MTGVPVLMYHAVLEDKKVNPRINPVHISITSFKQQIEWLFNSGYTTISITEMIDAMKKRRPTQKEIVLTFDDGYYSLLEIVTPILKQYNFCATLFLTTGPVDKKNYRDLAKFETSYPEDDRPLTWEEIKRMAASCWDIQAHSCQHLVHNMIPMNELFLEMNGSKDAIETQLNKQVRYYSYPYGSYSTKCLQYLSKTGYEAGFSVHPGKASLNNDIRRLPRIEINRHCDMDTFIRKIETGYGSRSENYLSVLKYYLFKNSLIKDFFKYIYDSLRKRSVTHT